MNDPNTNAARQLVLIDDLTTCPGWDLYLLPKLKAQMTVHADAALLDAALTESQVHDHLVRWRTLNEVLTGIENDLNQHCQALNIAGRLAPEFAHHMQQPAPETAPKPQANPTDLTGVGLFGGDPAAAGHKMQLSQEAREVFEKLKLAGLEPK